MQIKYLCHGKQINLTSENTTITSNNFSVDKYGNMTCSNAHITGGNINMLGDDTTPTILIRNSNNDEIEMYPSNINMRYYYTGANAYIGHYIQKGSYYVENETTGENSTMAYDYVRTPQVIQTSLEKIKKNIKESNINALELIKRAKIYEYNLKTEQDEDKKHIGFVIGDKYETPKEVISQSGEGIDTYTMSSIMWKAIQEQQKTIEYLQKEIKLLKGEKDE